MPWQLQPRLSQRPKIVRLVWTTDPHLNHVPVQAWERWTDAIASLGADGVVITGDISEGDDVVSQFHRIAETFAVPIYFVLGNHDFYRSSITATRQSVIAASRENPLLHYLTDSSAIELAEHVFLVGEDGWGDAVEGDYEGSPIRLNDFHLIEDFRRTDPDRWKQQLQELGAESAQRLKAKLEAIPEDAREVLVITHVPPFREACWYEGKTTDNNWAPFFVCGQVGRVLRKATESRRGCRFTVLCGHTHHEGIAAIASNLIVHTGAADYGHPDIEGMITINAGKLSLKAVT
jgi:predicted phosphohydrolase